MTPQVRAALQTLITVDDLRGEIGASRSSWRPPRKWRPDVLTPVRNRAPSSASCTGLPPSPSLRRAGSLVYFDLDGFKTVNDRFGHAAGDAALQAVAQRLSDNVRESDVVGRMGGDEFAVIWRSRPITAESKGLGAGGGDRGPARPVRRLVGAVARQLWRTGFSGC